MKRDQTEKGRISAHGQGMGTPTPGMVEARAREIAFINGRSSHQVTESDREEARRDLIGAGMIDSNADLEAEGEAAQWEPAPGSGGEHVPAVQAHDEQTDTERLVQEGIAEAEHEQMVEGTKQSVKRAK